MKSVTLTQVKNNFGSLMGLVRNGKTSLLIFERDTPVIKVVYAGDSGDGDEDNLAIRRLERAGLLQRAEDNTSLSLEELRKLRVIPKKKGVDVLQALLDERQEGR